jgi:hypothetical protein
VWALIASRPLDAIVEQLCQICDCSYHRGEAQTKRHYGEYAANAKALRQDRDALTPGNSGGSECIRLVGTCTLRRLRPVVSSMACMQWSRLFQPGSFELLKKKEINKHATAQQPIAVCHPGLVLPELRKIELINKNILLKIISDEFKSVSVR